MTEKQDELINEFQGLSKQIAEKIIDALSESMTELNKKLGEQFGENFGKFAEAIPQLLEWQETHRKTLADMQALLEKPKLSNCRKCSIHLIRVSRRLKPLPNTPRQSRGVQTISR